jgi:hypothetical protein
VRRPRSYLDLESGSGHEFLDEALKVRLGLGGDPAFSTDGERDVCGLGVDSLKVQRLELLDLAGLDLIQVTTDTGEEDASLLLDGHGDVLLLLEELSELLASVEELLGGGIQIGTELSEGGDLTVLGELELQGTSELLHGLDLGGGSNTGDGQTNVNCGADTLMEELGLKEDLTVRDGDDVSGDVSGDITSLSLNDGESSQGTGTVGLVHLGCALKKTGMEVEDITGVSLTTRGSSEEKGHLTVGNSLLGQIVVDDEGVLRVVTEVLTDSATRVGGQELEGSGIRGGGSNDDSVLEAVSLSEKAHDVGHGGSLLADGDVDAVEGLGVVSSLEDGLLVKDSVDGNGSFAGLSISNDQLTLSSSNGHLK